MKKAISLLLILALFCVMASCRQKKDGDTGSSNIVYSGSVIEGVTSSQESIQNSSTVSPSYNSAPNLVTSNSSSVQEITQGEEIVEPHATKITEDVKILSAHNVLSADEYYQYSQLKENEKAAYNRIKQTIEDSKSICKFDGISISFEDLKVLITRFFTDNPQYFYVSPSSAISYDAKSLLAEYCVLFYTDGENLDILNTNGEFKIRADREVISTQIAEFNRAVEKYLKRIPTNVSSLEKERRIHDIVINSVNYKKDTSLGNNIYTVYGAAVKNTAVCEGYSELFQYLCYGVGIKCTAVTGYSKSEYHMWNTVLIDGEWYNVDTTWDDGLYLNGTEWIPYYKYFNITDKELNLDHELSAPDIFVPKCISEQSAFKNIYALKIDDKSKAPKNIENAIDSAVKFGDEYIVAYIDIDNADYSDFGSYVSKYIFGTFSDVNKYLNKKDIKLEKSYMTVENFIIFSIK